MRVLNRTQGWDRMGRMREWVQWDEWDIKKGVGRIIGLGRINRVRNEDWSRMEIIKRL